MANDQRIHPENYAVAPDHPAVSWAALTPNDSTVLNPVPRALYVAAQGDVEIRGSDGNDETFPSVAAGTILPFRPRVLLTGTDATVIALY